MGTFTKGPWFVDHKSPFLVRAGDDIDGRHIAHVGPANCTPRFDVDEHNAQLIAAAPDLLESLENLLDAYSKPDQRMCCSGYECGCMGSTIYDQAEHYARAAISRAKGYK